MGLFRKKETGERAAAVMPRHIAVIMDGNGRWARKRGLPRGVGHSAGAEAFRTLVRYCDSLGIEQLTVFAFSTENWKRPQDEVDGIMDLLRKYLRDCCTQLAKENFRLRFLGDLDRLPEDIRELIARNRVISETCTGIIVNVCVNYGGRLDVVRAAQKLAGQVAAGELSAGEIDEDVFSRALWTGGLPDPDLVIRTGAESRLSNFLLWQSAYSELYFTDTLFPDFTPRRLDEALRWYAGRNRRFGGVKA
ncbi:MAG: di-trans,poly-cis-decaprenylcistransferase [Oscillospiraceae bacterium]|nr:di-trans,poly-cis-decaprenylcistransferase [Oscillospiraceae bacterium]